MQPTHTIWHNGKLIPWDEAKIHILTHTLHYGSGAFEGIRFYKTERGPAIFRLDDHINRFLFSSATLGMPITYSFDEIKQAVIQVATLNELEQGYIRPISFYGYGKMGVNPTGNPLEIAIACWIWGAYLPHDTVDIKTSRYIRIHPESTVVAAKLSGHYINGVLAALELRNTHYHEALLLDSDGYISEGVGENFFLVKDQIIYTPKEGTILNGITRDTVIELARKLGYEVEEINITLEEAYGADEAFFTGTAAEVTPIRSIDDKLIGKKPIGDVTTVLKNAYHEVVTGKNLAFIDYLTFLNPPACKATVSNNINVLKV